MFALRSGRLSLIDLSIELIVPRDTPAGNWSLFEIRGGQTVRLEHCALTLDNAAATPAAKRPDAAFFRLRSAAETDAVVGGTALDAVNFATLEIANSLVRGEAVFLQAEALPPLRLSWENGLLITDECLLSAAGASRNRSWANRCKWSSGTSPR